MAHRGYRSSAEARCGAMAEWRDESLSAPSDASSAIKGCCDGSETARLRQASSALPVTSTTTAPRGGPETAP